MQSRLAIDPIRGASPACEAALSMMGRTPWGLAGKINERDSTCFREMVSAVAHGVLRGFDQVHAFAQQGRVFKIRQVTVFGYPPGHASPTGI